MTALLLPFLVCGGLAFEMQEIPGLMFYCHEAYSPPRETYFVRFDIDGDGDQDLLTPTRTVLQNEGRFDKDEPVPGESYEPISADVWGRDLYLRAHGRLEIVRWEQGAWQTLLKQSITWEGAVADGDVMPEDPERPPFLMLGNRFLQDIDSDGTPEIVVVRKEGLWIYRKAETGYASAGLLKILPQPTLNAYAGWGWWEDESKRVFPARTLNCGLWLDKADLWIVDARTDSEEKWVRYQTKRYKLGIQEGRAAARLEAEQLSPSLPFVCVPHRLNNDDTTDFVGTDNLRMREMDVPYPLVEVYTSTDGGKTVQETHTVAFHPAARFSDVDGDGDLDKIIDRVGAFDNGIREIVARAMTSSKTSHELHVYLQGADKRFPEKPSFVWKGEIDLGEAPWRRGEMAEAYADGRLIVTLGDYNGDKRADLLLRDRPDRLSVYLAGPKGYSRRAEASVSIPRECSNLGAFDMDGDGRSDILVELGDVKVKKGKTEVVQVQVYFSRENRS